MNCSFLYRPWYGKGGGRLAHWLCQRSSILFCMVVLALCLLETLILPGVYKQIRENCRILRRCQHWAERCTWLQGFITNLSYNLHLESIAQAAHHIFNSLCTFCCFLSLFSDLGIDRIGVIEVRTTHNTEHQHSCGCISSIYYITSRKWENLLVYLYESLWNF